MPDRDDEGGCLFQMNASGNMALLRAMDLIIIVMGVAMVLYHVIGIFLSPLGP